MNILNELKHEADRHGERITHARIGRSEHDEYEVQIPDIYRASSANFEVIERFLDREADAYSHAPFYAWSENRVYFLSYDGDEEVYVKSVPRHISKESPEAV